MHWRKTICNEMKREAGNVASHPRALGLLCELSFLRALAALGVLKALGVLGPPKALGVLALLGVLAGQENAT